MRTDPQVAACESVGLQSQSFKAFGLRLGRLRKDRNVSVIQMAKLLGKTNKQIIMIEGGSGQISIHDISVLIKEFHVGFDWLCQDLIAENSQNLQKRQREVEARIVMELSRLNPGVLDRILKSIGETRAVGREARPSRGATADVAKEVKSLVSQLDLLGPRLVPLQE